MNFSSRALMVLGASVTTLALAADNGEQNAFSRSPAPCWKAPATWTRPRPIKSSTSAI
nr:hypothetical protein [Pseudomonas sp. BIGb0427]